MADLSAADPVAVMLGWLRSHPSLSAANVSGMYEAPWPRVRLTIGPGGAYDDLLWNSTAELTVEVIDHPGNTTGQAALWRLSLLVLAAAKQIVDRDVVDPAEPIVTVVRPSGTLAWSPLETGQGRWVISLSVQMHPPRV